MKKCPKGAIDEKITRLKQKRKALQQRQALHLYKQLNKLLGKAFDPAVVLSITADAWLKATTQEKEVWHSNAASFRESKHPQALQTRAADQCQSLKASSKEIPAHD